jgi:sulfate adenylyltransferase
MKLKIPTGLCIYLTGISGSGKTTVANILKYKLNKIDNRKITILDGDEIREHISKGLGFSKKDRSINIRRIGYLSNLINTHGGISICSNIAPYASDRLYNRNLITSNNNDYVEVFLKTSVQECIKRDPKGLYKINNKNIIESADEYEVPINNELTIHTEKYTKEETTKLILNYLETQNMLNIY